MKKRIAKKPTVVLTIGRSTRDLETFLRLLEAHQVTRLIDVRTILRSRHNPQFNCLRSREPSVSRRESSQLIEAAQNVVPVARTA